MKRVSSTNQYQGWEYQYLGELDHKGYPVGTKYDHKGYPFGTKYDRENNPTFIPRWDDEYIVDWWDYLWMVPAVMVVIFVVVIVGMCLSFYFWIVSKF